MRSWLNNSKQPLVHTQRNSIQILMSIEMYDPPLVCKKKKKYQFFSILILQIFLIDATKEIRRTTAARCERHVCCLLLLNNYFFISANYDVVCSLRAYLLRFGDGYYYIYIAFANMFRLSFMSFITILERQSAVFAADQRSGIFA